MDLGKLSDGKCETCSGNTPKLDFEELVNICL